MLLILFSAIIAQSGHSTQIKNKIFTFFTLVEGLGPPWSSEDCEFTHIENRSVHFERSVVHIVLAPRFRGVEVLSLGA